MEEEDCQMEKELIGKQVTVFKVDGFIKKGMLVSMLPGVIRLRFYDGGEELVPLVQISSIKIER